MGIIAENNQYYKGKKEILDEFSNSHRAILSTTAARNFSKPPGFLSEVSMLLEETGKNKLSALNYTITAEAIERELKQTGHDYSQTYKAARIAFELEKQTLLTALQNEFADLDRNQSLKEEELDRLFIELDIRRIILITTKTSIELEMETEKRNLSNTDRLTFDKESELVSEQVITATKKLDVIPYIDAILLTEQDILIEETANKGYADLLIAEKKLLLAKKDEILPLLTAKADEQDKLKEALWEQIEFQKEMLKVAIAKMAFKEDIVDNEIAILDAQIAVEDMRQLLIEQRHDLREDILEKEKEFLTKDGENLGLIDTQRSETLTQLQNDKVDIRSDNEDTEDTIVDADIISIETSKRTSVESQKTSISSIASSQASATRQTATAAATAKITSELIHLIGS